MYKGVMSYTPKTKIIATETEMIQGSMGLYKWADLKNKQELSKAINIASKYQVKDNQNLEEMLHIKFRTQGTLSEKLNHIKTEIDELDVKIKVAKIVKKYKALSDESKSLSGRKKNKFDEEHAQELQPQAQAQALSQPTSLSALHDDNNCGCDCCDNCTSDDDKLLHGLFFLSLSSV